ncbi:tetratricopeptide repeat protein [Colwellia psychrerythraea]|nr:hypothetical protein [Colwellia psychrerythraea]
MTSLSSSSFFLSEYLTEQLSNDNYRKGQLTFALKHNHISALTIEERNSVVGSSQWLTLNRELAKSQINSALKLGHWYQLAAESESNKVLTDKAVMWFEQAIRLGSQKAHLLLAQLYYGQDQVVKARGTLASLPSQFSTNDLTESVLLLRLKILIELGDIELAKLLLKSNHFTHDNNEAQRFLMDIEKYSVMSDKTTKNSYIADSSKCLTSLQLFATNLSHLKHIDQLIKRFTEQQTLAKYICLPTPKYISIKQLDCKAKAEQAISCDESRWQSITKGVNTRHIGLMLKEGGANVHLGILYFDFNDSADVFSHEVSHLLGFVDEYPLIKGHDKCQGVQQETFSHNIAVLNSYYHGELKAVRANILDNISWAQSIKASTPILQEIGARVGDKKHWRLGTPSEYQDEVGVYLSESCQNSAMGADVTSTITELSYSSFKPLFRHTQLRYFENEFPEEYLTILERRPSDFLMPSYHYNIALSLYQQGKSSTVKYWIDKAAEWESDTVRKLKILKGKL